MMAARRSSAGSRSPSAVVAARANADGTASAEPEAAAVADRPRRRQRALRQLARVEQHGRERVRKRGVQIFRKVREERADRGPRRRVERGRGVDQDETIDEVRSREGDAERDQTAHGLAEEVHRGIGGDFRRSFADAVVGGVAVSGF